MGRAGVEGGGKVSGRGAGWGGGCFSLQLKKERKKNNVLIIVDMILSWKNIL